MTMMYRYYREPIAIKEMQQLFPRRCNLPVNVGSHSGTGRCSRGQQSFDFRSLVFVRQRVENDLLVAQALAIRRLARNIHKILQQFHESPLQAVLNQRLCATKLGSEDASHVPTLAVLDDAMGLVKSTCEPCVEHIGHVGGFPRGGCNMSQVCFATIRQLINQYVPVDVSPAM